GFAPRDGSANPAPTPAHLWVFAPKHPIRSPVTGSTGPDDFHKQIRASKKEQPKKEDPGARRARVCRRMGEGLGAGGHTTRRWTTNGEVGEWFRPAEIIFGVLPCEQPGGAANAPHRPADRHGGRPEIPDIANGYEDARRPRRDPRRRSGFRPGTGWEGDRLGKP